MRRVAFIMCLLAGPALGQTQCRLRNTSFEATEGAGFAVWNEIGAVADDPARAVHGSHALRAPGPDLGSWAIAGVWQARDAAPGQLWRAWARAGHPSDDPLTGGCRAIINVEWRDAADQLISYETLDAADAGSPTDVLQPAEFVAGPAPAGTVTTRIVLAIVQPPTNDPGAAVFDLAGFERADPPEPETEWPDFPGGRTIDFAGYTWRVKGPGVYGPGPSFFSDDQSIVGVGPEGLRLAIDRVGGVWASSEVVLEQPLGYGEYRFTVAPDPGPRVGVPDDWDANVILGLFTWEYTGCYDGPNPENRFNEFDVEVGRWGDTNNDLAQFVAQPWDYPGNIERFPASWAEGPVTFSLLWLNDVVRCRAWRGGVDGPGTVIKEWVYAGPHVPRPDEPRVHLNFWQLGGPPTSGLGHSALISDFTFTPACALDGTEPRTVEDLYETERNPSDLDRDGLVTPKDAACLEQWLRERG